MDLSVIVLLAFLVLVTMLHLFFAYSLNCILVGMLHSIQQLNPQKKEATLQVASAAYLALLRSGSFRVRVQRELVVLREFIASETGRPEQDVQDEFEARAAGLR